MTRLNALELVDIVLDEGSYLSWDTTPVQPPAGSLTPMLLNSKPRRRSPESTNPSSPAKAPSPAVAWP